MTLTRAAAATLAAAEKAAEEKRAAKRPNPPDEATVKRRAAAAAALKAAATTPLRLGSLPGDVHDLVAAHLTAAGLLGLAPCKSLRASALARVTELGVKEPAAAPPAVPSSPATTAALLRLLAQTPRLARLHVYGLRTLSALNEACQQGLCQRIESLAFEFRIRDGRFCRMDSGDGGLNYDGAPRQAVTPEEVAGWRALMATVREEDPFPALTSLSLRHGWEDPQFGDPDFTVALFNALAAGACKGLRRLDFRFARDPDDGLARDEEMCEAFAEMLESRQELGTCARMAELPVDWVGMVSNDDWALGPRVYTAVLAGLERMCDDPRDGSTCACRGLYAKFARLAAECIEEMEEDDPDLVLPLKQLIVKAPFRAAHAEETDESMEDLFNVLSNGVAHRVEEMILTGYRESQNNLQPALEQAVLSGYAFQSIRILKVDGPYAESFLRGAANKDAPPFPHLTELAIESGDFCDDWEGMTMLDAMGSSMEMTPSSRAAQTALSEAVARGAFPRLETLLFSFDVEGFGAFAAALREGTAGARSCGRALKSVKLPVLRDQAIAYGEYASLMADGSIPNLEEIELLYEYVNCGNVLAALVPAIEAGGGRRLRRLHIPADIQRPEHEQLAKRLGRAMADAALCPCLEVLYCGDWTGLMMPALRRRWRVLKCVGETEDPGPSRPGVVLYLESGGYF